MHTIMSAKATIIFFKKVMNKYIKISKKRGRGLMPLKGGKQEVTDIDDIIHNSSYRQSDSAFFKSSPNSVKNAESD